MLDEVQRNGLLQQWRAVKEIERMFGEEFLDRNARGCPVTGKPVLSAFRKLSGDTVVWEPHR